MKARVPENYLHRDILAAAAGVDGAVVVQVIPDTLREVG